MVTIKDVAQKAGVSICTVSRALSGKGYLKEETKEKILKAVDELGYQRNSAAVSLKTGRSNVIALIVPDITNLFYAAFAKDVEQAAADLGYMLILADSDNRPEKESAFAENLSQGQADGVIMAPCSRDCSTVMRLRKLSIPVVTVNCAADSAGPALNCSNEKGACECVRYLIKKGHTNIGAVFQSFTNPIFEDRFNGMKRALKEAGLALDEKNCLTDLDPKDEARKEIVKLLKRPDRPTALFASSGLLAFNVYEAADEAGLSVPEDLSVTGYDNPIMAKEASPLLTSYRTPEKEMALAAVKTADSLIKGEKVKEHTVFEGELIMGGSVKNICN